MRFRIFPYVMGSNSAWALKKALAERGFNFLMLRHPPESHYTPQPTDLIINWGGSTDTMPSIFSEYRHNIINPPSTVGAASDKLVALELMSEGGVRVPDFSINRSVASNWAQEGDRVVVRTLSRASGGRGIELVGDPNAIPSAPLYTRYIKKAEEYRVHVLFGGVVDVQRKARSHDVPDDEVNWQIRNTDNGFIYAREDCTPDPDVIAQARRAVRVLRLDFGAVDVVWNEHYGEATVLEVNTACGLEGSTKEAYADTFVDYIDKRVRR